MNSEFLLRNKYIYVDTRLDKNQVTDSVKYIIVEISEREVTYITQNLTFGILNINELEEDVKLGDVYDATTLYFFSDDTYFTQEYIVYDISNDSRRELVDILLSLRKSNRYRDNDSFKRSVDISVICEDASYLKDFFIY